ncbi:MAG: 50S ribosomal protein L4 [Candidatus Pacebacteria bacterium]|nr:50S ribosomal protein L4 [Candidatus Paceibacterota bacterium]
MEFPLYNKEAKQVGTIDLSDSIFGLPMNQDLLHQIITSQMSNKRQVLAHTKGRGEVRGGGKKPWKQKGTGRARHGSIRSPIWRSGGVTGGPTKEKNFKKEINKKMMQKALKVALSSKARDGQLFIVDALTLEKPKTKEMATIMNKLGGVIGRLSNVLLVTPTDSLVVYKSARNLPYLNTIESRNLNPLVLLEANRVILSKESLAAIEKQWGKKSE